MMSFFKFDDLNNNRYKKSSYIQFIDFNAGVTQVV